MKKNSDTQEEVPRGYVGGGPRVHTHTTVSAQTRDLLKSLSGETGRITKSLRKQSAITAFDETNQIVMIVNSRPSQDSWLP